MITLVGTWHGSRAASSWTAVRRKYFLLLTHLEAKKYSTVTRGIATIVNIEQYCRHRRVVVVRNDGEFCCGDSEASSP